MAARRDGGLQFGFGMGKYTNRNVLDGYAGMSRGPEQITVRGSRRLFPRLDESSVGPIRYEVLEPMKRVRFALDPEPVPTIGVRLDLRGRAAAGHRGADPSAGPARATGSAPIWSATTRSGRHRGGWRSTAYARRSTPTGGCRPETTRGASATTWAHRPPTSTPSIRWPRWTSG